MSTDSPGTPPDAPPPPLPPPPPSDSDNQKRADDFGDRGRSLESTPDFQKGLDDFSERKAAQPEASKPAPVSPEPAAAVPADSGPVVNQSPDKGLVQNGPPDKGLVQDRQAERGSTQGPALSSNNERADALGSRTGEAADLNIPSNERTVREVTVPEVSEQQAEQPFNGSDDEGTPGSGDEWDLDKNSRRCLMSSTVMFPGLRLRLRRSRMRGWLRRPKRATTTVVTTREVTMVTAITKAVAGTPRTRRKSQIGKKCPRQKNFSES